MFKKIQQEIDALYPEMVEIRRYLHQHPELSFQEYQTAAYIADFYEQLGLPYQTKVGGNGVVATLKGGKPGKTVALRADFDALPIQDVKDVPYKSQVPNVMHACGHDGHTATLLVLAKVLAAHQEEVAGTIIFLHQHAEEYAPGGAKPMIEAGALKDVDVVFGNHLWATTPLGTVQTSKEAFMAGADRFAVTIQGQGGHGGYPHETKDALVIGSQLVTQLQTIVSRKMDPLDTAVVTVGKFTAGNAFNIIADTANLIGTVRYFKQDTQEGIMKEIEQIVKGVCLANGVTYTFNYEKGYPPLINHAEEAALVLRAAEDVDGVAHVENVAPVMGGEDFSYYVLEKPGAFFFTGAQKEGNHYPHHHPHFDFDERAMPIAAKTLFGAYLAYQKKHSV
ncbi:M20 family metallopeptidase [Virgibacillus halophilus]|uniref:M20 family metallopeptidase n=1 Tax=Tigheibacillus halophilus TaxID=361280 RepID=UPI0036440879